MSWTETVQRVAMGSFAEASAEERTAAAREVVTACAVASAAVALQPLPLVDAALMAPIQMAMVHAVGRVHGYDLDTKSIIELLGTFGASLVAQNVLLAAAKLVPFAGWLVGASMAYALTYAVGEVAHAYFACGRGLSAAEMRDMLGKVYKQKKAEKQAAAGKSSLKARLEELRAAYEAGAISQAEHDAKREDLLRAL